MYITMNTIILSSIRTVFIFVLSVVTLTTIASGQEPTDCDRNTVKCNPDKKYPYVGCPDPKKIVCKSYKDKPISGVSRMYNNFPPCYEMDVDYLYLINGQDGIIEMPVNNTPFSSTVVVFTTYERDINKVGIWRDMAQARDDIGCVCGIPRGSTRPCNCKIKVRFSNRSI